MTVDEDDLERVVGEALRALPVTRAPATLLPRVLARAGAGRHPMPGRPWFTWPWPAQAASLALAVLALALAGWTWPAVAAEAGQWLPAQMRAAAGLMTGAAETTSLVIRVLLLTWTAVVAPLAKVVLLLTIVLCAACAACVAALGRVALGGAPQS